MAGKLTTTGTILYGKSQIALLVDMQTRGALVALAKADGVTLSEKVRQVLARGLEAERQRG